MRIASGVNPPVVMKGVFGEFAAYPRTDDPAYLTMSPSWYDAHIVTRSVPLLGEVTCNVAFFPALIGALRDVEAAGLGDEIHTYSGCYAARTVARSPTAPPSNHAYGAAIDINAPENPYGATPTMDPKIVTIFQRWGFLWGGRYPDPRRDAFRVRLAAAVTRRTRVRGVAIGCCDAGRALASAACGISRAGTARWRSRCHRRRGAARRSKARGPRRPAGFWTNEAPSAAT